MRGLWRTASIRQKLMLCFAALLLPLAAQSAVFVVVLERVQESTGRMATLSFEQAHLAELQVLILKQIRLQKNYVLSRDARHVEEHARLRQRAQTVFETLISEAQRMRQEAWLAEYAQGAAQASEYDEIFQEFVRLVEKGAVDAAAEITLTRSDPLANSMLANCRALVELANSAVESERENAAAAARQARELTLATALAAIALGVLAAYLLALRIARPLQDVVYAAERIAGGDLRVPVRTSGSDEIGRLQRAVREMQRSLASIIGEVRNGVSSVASAAAQVAATAQSLADGTSQQAASVEETTASLEQMNASIRQSSDNTSRMEQMAIAGAKAATDSGGAVQETLEAMRSISQRIAIVDEIAHRTNMLALNAAIEASRAGEHGRGFAVVSTEIRLLAERSREAASEISRLAASSVHRAEHSGDLLGELVPAIAATAELVQQVATASREQAIGVDQVTQAIGLVDGVTQHNSASAEQLASTAEQLAAQSDSLNTLCAYFRTAEAEEVGRDAAVDATPRAARAVAPRRSAASPSDERA